MSSAKPGPGGQRRVTPLGGAAATLLARNGAHEGVARPVGGALAALVALVAFADEEEREGAEPLQYRLRRQPQVREGLGLRERLEVRLLTRRQTVGELIGHPDEGDANAHVAIARVGGCRVMVQPDDLG